MSTNPPTPRVLVIVEGVHDVSFLKVASRILHVADNALPDLSAMEADDQLIFLPVGGTVTSSWHSRLRPLGLPEFHLYDREGPSLAEARRFIADAVNRRPNCRAFVTSRRQLECYLHPKAIYAASGLAIDFTENEDVAEIAARAAHSLNGVKPWEKLTTNRRHKLRHRAKRWLNTDAVARMTPELFAEQDTAGEVADWLRAIGELFFRALIGPLGAAGSRRRLVVNLP